MWRCTEKEKCREENLLGTNLSAIEHKLGKSLVQKNQRSDRFQEPLFLTVHHLLRIHQRFIRAVESRLPIQHIG